jgi:hypothetical protein
MLLKFLLCNAWKIVNLTVSVATLFYLVRYARDTRRLANDTQTIATNSLTQLTQSERPFVAVSSIYDKVIEAPLVYAHNQGVGPSLDLGATLYYDNGSSDSYGVGCLPANGKFQFLIGAKSVSLRKAIFKYKSMSGHRWRTEIELLGGNTFSTAVISEDEG